MNDKAKTLPRSIAFSDLRYLPRFEYGDQAEIAEVTGADDGTVLGTGFVRLTKASIPWTVTYDEVLLVLEGQVTVHTESGVVEAGPMDSIWLPAGTVLRYEAERALVFYALYPNIRAETEAPA